MKNRLQRKDVTSIALFLLILFVSGCHKMELPPLVTTASVTSVGLSSATCGGTISTEEGREVTARGICWSTTQNPTITDNHTSNGSGLGSFTGNLTSLTSETTYYVRAYATNAYGTAYGAQQVFRTNSGSINGHEYVDLGLPSGLKWATCNVGASSPEGYGDYFAWGETTTKSTYTESNSVTYGNSSIGNIAGNAQYDAARANWGGSWRLPTKAEMQELLYNCTETWTTRNGVYGRLFTSNINGNSIFLPAAGFRHGSSLRNAGESGDYWSATPHESDSDIAYHLFFYNGGANWVWYHRYIGYTIRPVSE